MFHVEPSDSYHNMKKYFLAFTLVILSQTLTNAQGSMLPKDEEARALAVVTELFDAYRDGDSTRVSNTFTKDAVLQRAFKNKAGEYVLTAPDTHKKFVGYVGGGLDKLHDEQLWNSTVHVDQNLASIWTEYAFFLDKEFSHCGAENFLLQKINNEWKIFHLVDTRSVETCNVPETITMNSTK